ncbi:MAG TPA: subclass B3 metallo-beta-lactamase [Bryobacteraceae bacterium]|jgi:metallo-beta-lactamase class B|nr:subclass B3 metallo-beta-lactamase [Bryobacteraceae bacterium]
MRSFVLTAALSLAAVTLPHTAQAAPPHRVIGNIYYVGEDDLASFLIVTPEGNILINTGYEFSVPVIRAGAKSLGFRFEDIKILLVTHAHSDHAGGLAKVRKLTGAKMWAIEQEAELLNTGGKTDYLFGSAGWFEPVKVDHVFKDGDKIELGGTVITAHLTPGHTKGSTSYSMEVTENGKLYHVLVANMPNMNEGVNFIDDPKYPNIVADYTHAFEVLESLPCDVFLSSHTGAYRLTAKYHRGMPYSPETFVDPEGYREAVARAKQRFFAEVKEQRDEEQFNHDRLNFRELKEQGTGQPAAPPQ